MTEAVSNPLPGNHMDVELLNAEQRRDKIVSAAFAIGIDQDFVERLVDEFYFRVRRHPDLGPVFEQAIGDDWTPHLKQMKLFWASVALNAGTYSGKPVPAHKKHKMIGRHHFDLWLALFENTLTDLAPTQEAVDYFMIRARRIAESLKLAKFGSPGLEFLNKHG